MGLSESGMGVRSNLGLTTNCSETSFVESIYTIEEVSIQKEGVSEPNVNGKRSGHSSLINYLLNKLCLNHKYEM